MRRVALAIVGTVTGLVLLLSFKTHSSPSTPPAAIASPNPGSGSSSGTGSTDPAPAAGSPSTSRTSPASGSSSSKTVTGDSADTQWGPVQVQITVRNGKVTNVKAVDYPSGNPRDDEINSYAIPQLNQETLSAQSAGIDTVSGATVTSDGYISSLQSALDKAGL